MSVFTHINAVHILIRHFLMHTPLSMCDDLVAYNKIQFVFVCICSVCEIPYAKTLRIKICCIIFGGNINLVMGVDILSVLTSCFRVLHVQHGARYVSVRTRNFSRFKARKCSNMYMKVAIRFEHNRGTGGPQTLRRPCSFL